MQSTQELRDFRAKLVKHGLVWAKRATNQELIAYRNEVNPEFLRKLEQ